jgi:hypothetical protein
VIIAVEYYASKLYWHFWGGVGTRVGTGARAIATGRRTTTRAGRVN